MDVPLPHNSLAVMLPPCQELWTHEIVREGGGRRGRGQGARRKGEGEPDVQAEGTGLGRSSADVRVRQEVRVEDAAGGRAGSRVRAKYRQRRGDGRRGWHDAGDVLLHVRSCERGKPCKFYKPVKVVAL